MTLRKCLDASIAAHAADGSIGANAAWLARDTGYVVTHERNGTYTIRYRVPHYPHALRAAAPCSHILPTLAVVEVFLMVELLISPRSDWGFVHACPI